MTARQLHMKQMVAAKKPGHQKHTWMCCGVEPPHAHILDCRRVHYYVGSKRINGNGPTNVRNGSLSSKRVTSASGPPQGDANSVMLTKLLTHLNAACMELEDGQTHRNECMLPSRDLQER